MLMVQTPHPLIHHRNSPFTHYNQENRISLLQQSNENDSYENNGFIMDKIEYSEGEAEQVNEG